MTVDSVMDSRFAGKGLVKVENLAFHIVDSLPDRPSGM